MQVYEIVCHLSVVRDLFSVYETGELGDSPH